MTDRRRPRIRPGVEAVDVDGQLVLWEPHSNQVHRLDPTASLLWPLLDGSATVTELALDVADVFGIRVKQAERDIAALVESLAATHLLDDADPRSAPDSEGRPTPRYLEDPPDS